MIEGRATIQGRDISQKYRVTFTPYIPIFKLKWKLELLHTGKSQADRWKSKYIINVRPIDSVPVCCIQVESPNRLLLVSKSMTPTHSTRAEVGINKTL